MVTQKQLKRLEKAYNKAWKKSNRAERKYKYADYIREKAWKRYYEARREYEQDIEIQKLRRFIENVVENYLNSHAKKGR